jgi:ABC-2 type transport system ATP-binding protein
VLIIAKGRLVADDRPDELRARAGKSRFLVSVLRGAGSRQDEAKTMQDVLAAIPGVERTRFLDRTDAEDELQFEVLPSGSQDLRADIFRAAVAKDRVLVGLRREGQDLEQVFRQLTTGGNGAGTERGASRSSSARHSRSSKSPRCIGRPRGSTPNWSWK